MIAKRATLRKRRTRRRSIISSVESVAIERQMRGGFVGE
jgi:hypothetical protein